MSFKKALETSKVIFFDGPMETRIEYGTNLELDKEMSIFLLTDTEEGSDALKHLYRTDIEVAIDANVPIILNAPSFRASKEHCKRLNIADDADNIYKINERCISLVKEVRDEFPKYVDQIFITAPIGPKYAGFTPDQIDDLETEINYHQEEIDCVNKIGVDLISIAAMPGALEAMGAAIAASKTNTDYVVGFVLTKEGKLLDDSPLSDVIDEIDNATQQKPLGYIIGCTHPSIAESAIADNKPQYQRIIGIKANGSAKPPKDLLNLEKPEADKPDDFAKALSHLGKPRGFKIYGGCCGTDHLHLKAMIKSLK